MVLKRVDEQETSNFKKKWCFQNGKVVSMGLERIAEEMSGLREGKVVWAEIA